MFLRTSSGRFAPQLGVASLVAIACSVSAQDEPQTKQRLEFMQAALEDLKAKSSELKDKGPLTFASKPLLRYADPTRGGVGYDGAANTLLDATVWRLGTEGAV